MTDTPQPLTETEKAAMRERSKKIRRLYYGAQWSVVTEILDSQDRLLSTVDSLTEQLEEARRDSERMDELERLVSEGLFQIAASLRGAADASLSASLTPSQSAATTGEKT